MSKNDTPKTKQELLDELDHLKSRIAHLESFFSNDLKFEEYFHALSNTDVILYECVLYPDNSAEPIFASSNTMRLLGYSPDEYLGNSQWWFHNIHPDDQSKVVEQVHKLSIHKALTNEYRFRHKSGHWIWVKDQVTMTQKKNTDSTFLSGSWTIIDDQKKLQEQHKQQSDLFQVISDFQSEFIKDIDTHDFFEKILNYLLTLTQSEYGFIGQILQKTKNQPYLKTYALTNISWNKETREFYDQNAPSGLEFTNLDTLFGVTIKTGEVVISNQPGTDPRRGGLPPGHPSLNAFLGLPIFHAQKLVGMVGLANRPSGYTQELADFLNPFLQTCGTLIDAHQSEQKRKEIENILAENRNQYEIIFNTVIDGIVTINSRGQIQSFNTAAEKIFGYKNQEVIGQNIKILMPEPYHSEHDEYILSHQKTRINKVIGIGREGLGKKKDGTIIPVDLAVNEVKLSTGTLYVGILRDITERKKSEKALLESEERFRTLTGLAPVGIYETDTQGNCLFVNDRWCELTGLTPELAAGTGWTNALFSEDRTRVFEAWQNAVQNKVEFQEEYRFQKPAGEIIWVSGRAIELNDDTGTPRGYIGTVADITQIKDAEAALLESEERIRALYEVASEPNLSFEQQIENVLKVGCEKLALSMGIVSQIEAENYIIKSVYAPDTDLKAGTQFDLKTTYCSIVLEANRPFATHHMAQSKWHNHPCYKNFQLETYIGVSLNVSGKKYGTLNFSSPKMREMPFTQADLDFVQLVGQWISTTLERQHTTEMLATQIRQQKALLNISRVIQELKHPQDLEQVTQTFAKQLNDLNIAFDSLSIHRLVDEEHCIFENHMLTDQNQYTYSSVPRPGIYKEWKDKKVIYRKDIASPEFQEGLPSQYLKNNPELRSILQIPFENGTVALRSTKPHAFSESEIELIKSNIEALSVGILRTQDLESIATRNQELEKATAELSRSNQELEQFAYVASHDLQEPLRVITNYLQLLDRRFGKELNESAHTYIDRVIGGATRMKTLIQDLLSYSRVTTKAQPFESVDLSRVFQDIKSDLELVISETHAQITNDPLPHLKADKTQIKQLFQNLISNAIKFQKDQIPEIHISATETDTHYQFAVSDNGIGIEPQFAERVFVIFQRLHTREEYQGTGIGLAICKKIVERHDGQIWLEPNTEQGSTFSFTISKTLS